MWACTNIHYRLNNAHSTSFHAQDNRHLKYSQTTSCLQCKQPLSHSLLPKLQFRKSSNFLLPNNYMDSDCYVSSIKDCIQSRTSIKLHIAWFENGTRCRLCVVPTLFDCFWEVTSLHVLCTLVYDQVLLYYEVFIHMWSHRQMKT